MLNALIGMLFLNLLLLTIIGKGRGTEDAQACPIQDPRLKKLQLSLDKLVRLTQNHICQGAQTTTNTFKYKDVCPEAFQPSPQRSQKMVVCRFSPQSFDDKFTLKQIDTNLCTHALLEGYFDVNYESFKIILKAGIQDFESVVSFFKSSGVKVWLIVGDWEDNVRFSEMLKAEARRVSFAEEIVALVSKFGLDGIAPRYVKCPQMDCPKIKTAFAKFAKILSSQLRPLGVLLFLQGADTIMGLAQMFDFKELKASVDIWLVMCMKSQGWWSSKTEIASSIEHVTSCLGFHTGNIAREKMILSVPATFDPVLLEFDEQTDIKAPAARSKGNQTLTSLKGICNMVNYGGGFVVHNASKIPNSYAYKDKDWVSFENTFTVRMKVEIALKNNLTGIYLQDVAHDDYDGQACWCGKYPLLRTINEELRGTGKCRLPACPQPPPK